MSTFLFSWPGTDEGQPGHEGKEGPRQDQSEGDAHAHAQYHEPHNEDHRPLENRDCHLNHCSTTLFGPGGLQNVIDRTLEVGL